MISRVSYRRANVLLNLFELWVGLAGIVSGIIYLTDLPALRQASITLQVGEYLAISWLIMYTISGVLIWAGLLLPSPRLEVAGLCLLGSATAIEGLSIGAHFSISGIGTAIVYLSLTAAAWTRAGLVFKRATDLYSAGRKVH